MITFFPYVGKLEMLVKFEIFNYHIMKLSSQSLLHACCILFSLVLSCFFGLAQEHNLNQFYNSSFVPEELNTSPNERLEELMISYKKEHNIIGDLTSAQKEFVFEYHYFQEKLNKSGKVFYGDEISRFLNQIKDTILANRPEKERIKIFLTDYSDFNAFTNDFGNIYVNVATVAKADNPIELFGIIAHEIAHVLQHHSFQMANIDEHLTTDKIENIRVIDEFETHKFSRNQELEADSLSFLLLNEIGIDVNLLKSLYDKLDYSANPVYPLPISLKNIWSNNLVRTYTDSLLNWIPSVSLYSKIAIEDSALLLSTHPTVEERRENYETIKKNFERHKEFNWQPEFDKIKKLAAKVLVKTLLLNDDYIEALYLTEQLLVNDPSDEYLKRTKLKLMLLTTQSKYLLFETPIVNLHGESCSDEAFLQFRYGILLIPALEMNIITILELENSIQNTNDDYLSRLLDFSYQFLYKYNPGLITLNSGNYLLDVNKKYYEISYAFDRSNFYSSEQITSFKKNETDGYKVQFEYFTWDKLVNQYRGNFGISNDFNQSILNYRERRNAYENGLAVDEFDLHFNPLTSFINNRNGVFIQKKPFEKDARFVLVQSDTYVMNQERLIDKRTHQASYKFTPDIEQTCIYEEIVNETLNISKTYDILLTNDQTASKQTSCRDNYLHNLTYTLIKECLYYTDLVYSVADEEIQQWIRDEKVSVIAYNINILIGRHVGAYKSIHYDILFDVNNLSVVFVGKESQNASLTPSLLKRIFLKSFNARKTL